MRESCTSGSVRGARGNSRPYRNLLLHLLTSLHGTLRPKAGAAARPQLAEADVPPLEYL
jgi:hypothetical protein